MQQAGGGREELVWEGLTPTSIKSVTVITGGEGGILEDSILPRDVLFLGASSNLERDA